MNNTQRMFANACPYDNKYQGDSLRYLFVCSAGLLRSPTAANVATKFGINARSCGADPKYALILINPQLIKWAHKIVFMNSSNKDEVGRLFPRDADELLAIQNKSTIWNIEDDYDYMNPQLVQIVTEYLTGSR